jgi:hypothetical protein
MSLASYNGVRRDPVPGAAHRIRIIRASPDRARFELVIVNRRQPSGDVSLTNVSDLFRIYAPRKVGLE